VLFPARRKSAVTNRAFSFSGSPIRSSQFMTVFDDWMGLEWAS
jgi:hypothetical protein